MSVLSLDVPPSLTSGTTLSDTSGIAKTAAQQFVEILVGDGTMQPLFPVVIEKAGLEKFKRNFFRLLTRYAVELRAEASSPIQTEAARLVRSRANFIVYLVIKSVQHEEPPNLPQIAVSESDRELDLERFLQQQLQQTQQYCEPIISSIDPQPSALNPEGYIDEDDEVGEPGRPDLINLDEVKKFMVESQAYKQLRNSFCHFVFPSEEITETGSRPTGKVKSAILTPYRLHWICVGCRIERGLHLITNLLPRVVVINITTTSSKPSLALSTNSLISCNQMESNLKLKCARPTPGPLNYTICTSRFVIW
jgi:hypothetical protein